MEIFKNTKHKWFLYWKRHVIAAWTYLLLHKTNEDK